MKTIKRTLLLFFLLALVLSLTLLPSVVGGELLFMIFLAFLFLLFFLSIIFSLITWTPFSISSRFALSTLVISVLLALFALMMSCVFKWMPNFEDPVSEEHARVMAVHWLKKNGIKGSPGYVFARKGDDAGDIGYYVFEVKGEKTFLTVPADARFYSFYFDRLNRLSYLDFYSTYVRRRSPIMFSNTLRLKLKSLANKILSQKSKEQRAWSEVLEKRNEGDEGEVLK